nr:hypothetical protein [Tanacetum cinerariifolium]
EFLPVLRPFAQLCQPLEDGTIPAIEALRLALGWPDYFYRDRFTAKFTRLEDGDCYVRVESYSDDSGGWIRFNAKHSSWLFDGFDNGRSEVVNP